MSSNFRITYSVSHFESLDFASDGDDDASCVRAGRPGKLGLLDRDNKYVM